MQLHLTYSCTPSHQEASNTHTALFHRYSYPLQFCKETTLNSITSIKKIIHSDLDIARKLNELSRNKRPSAEMNFVVMSVDLNYIIR